MIFSDLLVQTDPTATVVFVPIICLVNCAEKKKNNNQAYIPNSKLYILEKGYNWVI